MTARRWQQTAVDSLFVLTEAIPWFAVVVLIATGSERGFRSRIVERIQSAVASGDVDPARAEPVIAAARASADTVVAGPSVLLVVATAAGAYFLMRWLARAGIGGSFGGAVLLLVSVVALNVAMHIGLAGDLAVWDNDGVARFLADPAGDFPEQLDVVAFVESPTLDRAHGAAAVTTFVGLTLLWVRFLVAGRSAATFERVLRSFTVGFVVLLTAMAVARFLGVGTVAPYAIGYFVVGLLALALAHSARRRAEPGEPGRMAPWAVSVTFTLAVLTASALLFGLLAFLDAGRFAAFVAQAVGFIIGWILVIVLTPIFWVLESVLRLVLPEGVGDLFEGMRDFAQNPVVDEEEAEERGMGIPGVVIDGAKLLALLAVTYGSFLLARAILRRRLEAGDGEYAEVRERAGQATGIGSLLRNLVPRGGLRASGPDWMRRQPIYRLFGRAVADARERGLRRREGETPLEFGATGSRLLDAPVFEPIAGLFDRARYGRHFPERAEVERLGRELAQWEQANPATEELRQRIAGARPLGEADRIALGIQMAKRAARGDPHARDFTGMT